MTDAVLALAMSEARTIVVNCEVETNVVARALPFHFTIDPETKPVPFTVRMKSGPPGAVASGTSGWLMRGTGFVCIAPADIPVTDLLNPAKARRRPAEQRTKPIKTRGLKKADRDADCFFILDFCFLGFVVWFQLICLHSLRKEKGAGI